METIPQRVIERFWENVTVASGDVCWEWNLSIGSHGYGQVGWHVEAKNRSTMTTAHRVAWVAAHGPIPDELTVDHLCYNRRCCNPNHLRLLSNIENARNNAQSRKTHCIRGHEFDAANTYIDGRGHRKCRECARIYRHEREQRRARRHF